MKAAGSSNATKRIDGKPCVKCGTAERYVSSGECVACVKVRNASRSAARRDASAQRQYYGDDLTAEYYRDAHFKRCEWCQETLSSIDIVCRTCNGKLAGWRPPVERRDVLPCDLRYLRSQIVASEAVRQKQRLDLAGLAW